MRSCVRGAVVCARAPDLRSLAMRHDPKQLLTHIDVLFCHDPSLTLRELAHTLGIDRHVIERAVREIRGVSFREMQKQTRLMAALELLRIQNDLLIKEIADSLGFSPNAFSRFIRTMTGKPPTQHRYTPDTTNGR